ncbi:OLC1v1035399C1 [Oldenlandia corymbosa var. corymbosa]|uniref:OLC1v1035399C1 n=1 Tax=Oldenlandia corymbosa var. corymbosa TaxID=529605 RepID=A0AAV1CU36_OLDCO|nr:OLC1v1035399C1 [Oldenlandia corymbosa var. corymbosa]
MKFHAIELSLRKPQTRKIPNISLLVAFAIIVSVISIYSPSIRYRTSNLAKSPPNLVSVEEELVKPTTTQLTKDGDLRRDHDDNSPLCHGRDSEEELQNAKKGVEEEPAKHVGESEVTKSSATEVKEESVKNEEHSQDVTKREEEDEQESEAAKSSETQAREAERNEDNSEKPEDGDVAAAKEEAQNVSKRDEEESPVHEQEYDITKSPETKAQEVTQGKKENPDKPNEEGTQTTESSAIVTPEAPQNENCDLFIGEWVPNPEGPYYTNSTCFVIPDHRNCMKYGRPNTEFLKWRWQPDSCELPVFDPHKFLEFVWGKSIAFVGDSLARNHVHSLMCLLTRVLYPHEISNSTDENRIWEYKEYNFRMSILWAPYLVRSGEITNPNDGYRSFNLFLDEPEQWSNQIKDYDYVIISAGHWFLRPTMFYENGTLMGCLYCPNAPHYTPSFSYQRAWRTALKAINSINYKGVTFLRTLSPEHFENGTWDKGGNCARTRPFKRNETSLTDGNLNFYTIQLEELKIAQEEGEKNGLKFRLLDATKTMLLRPDGHPSRYGHKPTQAVEPNDCVHWCLPGPIDTWNEFLLELMKRAENKRSVT